MGKFGGGGEKCGRCEKTVYATELITAAKRAWHKSCFKCKSCGTRLELRSYKDWKEEIYCNGCYGNVHQPFAKENVK
ncbi:hypothetical protein SNEBB_003724 [Seison nebaliae]|nr:hypothetical protein SNEBB_003724 [Seison nebaliae]